MYARINRGRSSKEPGPAFIMLGNHLALVCLFLGAALAIFVSGAFEQRKLVDLWLDARDRVLRHRPYARSAADIRWQVL
jgi:hypothetical protein